MQFRKGFRHLVAFTSASILAILAISVPCAALTPAGTSINAGSAASYSDSNGAAMSPATSLNTSVVVGQVYGVSATAAAASQTVSPGAAATFALTVGNTGNGSDTLVVTPSVPGGWQAGVFVDANANGQVDSGELKSSYQTSAIAAGASQSVKIALVAPASAANGSTASTSVKVASASDSSIYKSVAFNATVTALERIREWSMLGYFPSADSNRIAIDFVDGDGDAAPGVLAGDKDWTPLASATETINLSSYYNNAQNCVAYAGVYIQSDVDRQATLRYTSSGQSQVWLNGSAVYTETTLPSNTASDRVVNINLFAGWNRLVLKLAQSTGTWTFSAVIKDADGTSKLPDFTTTPTQEPQTTTLLSNITVKDVSTNSATIEWTTDYPTSTFVDYSPQGETTLSMLQTPLALSHSIQLTGLTPGTTYNYLAGGYDVFGYDVADELRGFDTLPAAEDNKWITNWLINGAYTLAYTSYLLPTNFLGNETTIQPTIGMTTRSRIWKSAATNSYGVLDLLAAYPSQRNAVAYAHTYVYSPIKQTVLLKTGSNDGIKVWVNGTNVLNRNLTRNLIVDNDSTRITLKVGWNRILTKTSQFSGAWQMCARITSLTGQPVAGLQYQIKKP